MDQLKHTLQRHRRLLATLLFGVLLLATRLPHLGGAIDDPHAWRQADTAQYAREFFRHGIDLLHPAVNWMGGYKTVVFEFPLPEAIMALAYHVFGEQLPVARLITLLFFSGSALYLFLIVRTYSKERFAYTATCVYALLPLSQFYSRAIHIDFAAVFFAHAMAFHLLRAFKAPRLLDIGLAISAAILGFLIKAPYLFYFALPLLVVALQGNIRRNLSLLATCFLAALAAFYAWRQHTEAINGAAPDWSFLPRYTRMVNMDAWYYGPLRMRGDAEVWSRLWGRISHDVGSKAGIWMAVIGLIVALVITGKRQTPGMWPMWAWAAGVAAYLLIFFNLNYIHDYYQIPLLAVFAIFIAMAINAPYCLFRERHSLWGHSAALLLFMLFAGNALAYANSHYYKRDALREEAGRIVAQHTPPNALIIAASDIGYVDCRDPRLLYASDRIGWSLANGDLTASITARLQQLGASHLVILQDSKLPQPTGYGKIHYTQRLLDGEHSVFVIELATP